MTRLVNGRPWLRPEPFRPERFLDGDVAWANSFTAGEENNLARPTPEGAP